MGKVNSEKLDSAVKVNRFRLVHKFSNTWFSMKTFIKLRHVNESGSLMLVTRLGSAIVARPREPRSDIDPRSRGREAERNRKTEPRAIGIRIPLILWRREHGQRWSRRE